MDRVWQDRVNVQEKAKVDAIRFAKSHGLVGYWGSAAYFAILEKLLAERAGFEPAIRLHVYTLSRRALSTTQTPLPHYLVFNFPQVTNFTILFASYW